jgi:hypothetical protein
MRVFQTPPSNQRVIDAGRLHPGLAPRCSPRLRYRILEFPANGADGRLPRTQLIGPTFASGLSALLKRSRLYVMDVTLRRSLAGKGLSRQVPKG